MEATRPQVAAPLAILWTLPYLPWPTTSGGKLRQYHLLRSLAARGHRITLLIQSKNEPDAAARDHLAAIVHELIVLPRRPLRHPLTLAAALCAPYPLLASVNGLAPALSARLSQLLARQHWDVVQIEHSYGAQPFLRPLARCGQAFFLTEHNVESAIGTTTYQHLPVWLRPYVFYDRWRYRRWEKRVLAAAARVAAVTTADADALARVRGGPVDVVINGVDTRAFAEVRPNPASCRILFVGNFEYPPNLDAVAWALRDILPLLWQRMPNARFAVCGYAMPAQWARQWPDPRVEWLGFVPDLTVQQAQSAVFLAPLREGGGSKLKVLEALAAGMPLASTPQGVSGLAVADGEHYLAGHDAASLADALYRLLAEPARAGCMGEAGRHYATSRHDWQVAADQLETLYRERPHAHRS